MVSLQGKIWVPKRQLEAAKRSLVQHIELTRAEAGCLHFQVQVSADDPQCFEVSEEFSSDADFEAHQLRAAASPWGALSKGFRRHYQLTGRSQGDDVTYMEQALVLAEAAAAAGEVPVGAVLVRNREIIGEGANQPIGSQDPTSHAEIAALRQAAARQRNYRLPDSVLYVTIEPCVMCVGALIHARVARVVFGAREPKSGSLSSHRVIEQQGANHRFDVLEGVLAGQCGELMQDFFSRRR